MTNQVHLGARCVQEILILRKELKSAPNVKKKCIIQVHKWNGISKTRRCKVIGCFRVQMWECFFQQFSLQLICKVEMKKWLPKSSRGPHNGPHLILDRITYTNIKGQRSFVTSKGTFLLKNNSRAVPSRGYLCYRLVMNWIGFNTAFRLALFLGISFPNPFLAHPCLLMVGRCGDLVANRSPWSPLHSQLWLAGDHQITKAKSTLHGQNVFIFFPCNWFIRKFLKN